MGTLDQDKISKKRKRSKSLNNSSLEEHTVTKSDDNEILSPDQKSAKKRKQNTDMTKHTEPVPTKEEDHNEEKKSKKRKRESQHEEIEKNLPVSTPKRKKNKNQGSNESLSQSPEKTKSTEKSKKKKQVKEDTVTSPKTKENVKKDKKSKVVQVNKGKEMQTEKKKKNKKENGSTSFGVVDAKLLKDSGGENIAGEKKPERPTRINRAVDYLHNWKTNRKSWKFNKNFQSLLIKALYNPVIIDGDDFETLLLHLEECKGNARDKLKADAMALIKKDEDHLAESVDEDMEKRARAVIQMLG